MSAASPRITICIPHWQVERYVKLCLRSIVKHSAKYDLEVIVVDNGSRDSSLDYLRSLKWIRLVERPEEVHTNWPHNVFTAWDRGLELATGELYVTMHSDTFVRQDGWLDPLVREIRRADDIAASGAWKLEIEHPLYTLQKRIVGSLSDGFKRLVGRQKPVRHLQRDYPRDYCAMYRANVVRRHGLTFCSLGTSGGGLSIATQLWQAGYRMGMVPVREMVRNVYHVAHGTAALRPEKPLNHRRAQRKVETKVADLFAEPWIQALENETAFDVREPISHAA